MNQKQKELNDMLNFHSQSRKRTRDKLEEDNQVINNRIQNLKDEKKQLNEEINQEFLVRKLRQI